MIPSSSDTSLFIVGFWTLVLSYWWIIADKFAKFAVLFSLWKNKEYSFNSIVNLFVTHCWLVDIHRDRVKQELMSKLELQNNINDFIVGV